MPARSQGINDRIALGGWRGMSTYMLRYYELHYRLWEPNRPDYNHLWAETFLATTLNATTATGPNVTVLRGPDVFNYTEFLEVPPKGVYMGGDMT